MDQTKHRVSLAYFFGPQVDSMIVPLVSSKDNVGVVPKYRNVKVKEYLDLKAKHFEKVSATLYETRTAEQGEESIRSHVSTPTSKGMH
ncbi:hypothetical protein H5410_001590 [Solanum commersonii]|uniref:Uncharacterized protein n=1 Tax=Solanum commersonii TaxID=4109 RepID=A0A9J6AZL9_SOLCO|nr:hypothetical protein H5410_001590 [Solanum commersonii]